MAHPDPLDIFREARAIAVVRAPSRQQAVAAAEALADGGLQAIEIACTTPEAAEGIAELSDRYAGRLYVGAGTVLSRAEAEAVSDAGALFLASPGTDPAVIAAGRDRGTTVLAGAFTPTEVMHAQAFGADAVKLFPASLGGVSHLRALREPLPEVPFVPTGGIDTETIADWFADGALAVGVGGAICSQESIASGRYGEITERARRLVEVCEEWMRATPR